MENITKKLKELFSEETQQITEQDISFNTGKFPDFNFFVNDKISDETREKLDKLLLKKYNLKDFTQLEKALFAFIWKQGDYKTFSHFADGLLQKEKKENDKKGIVMYQFGKFIKDYKNNPIIDQHVIRAYRYSINTSNDKNIIDEILNNDNISTISDIDRIITDYTIWYKEKIKIWELTDIRLLDKYIFSLGKQLKEKRNAAK